MRSKIEVLVADDNADVLMATADLIRDYPGVEVVSRATNVEEALQCAESCQPHIAFIDAWLSGGGAQAVALRIKELSPATIVVALASAKELELESKLRSMGAAGCYEKESLNAALPRILAAVRFR